MVTVKEFRTLALSYSGASESPHFERTSFRVNRKIFATLDEQKKIAVVKLTPVDQSAFCAFDETVISPVHGTWGRQGWTQIDLAKVKKTTLRDAVTTAYTVVTTKSLPKKRI